MYNETALANAQAQGLTSVQVAAMGYSLIAELAEVELGPNGESPADFFYVQVRTYVVNALTEAEADALKEEEEKKLKAFLDLNSKDSTLGKMSVYRNEDGDIIIK